MQWYDPLLIMLALIGVMFIFFGSFHGKKWVWGIICILLAGITKLGIVMLL